MEERIFSYDPVVPPRANLLILGTIASVESLKRGFYYAHPRNCFWPMLADIYGEKAPTSIDEKIELLNRHDIALWDTARSCVRPGSLDSAMRDIELNDIPGLLRASPGIRRVLLNGGTAYTLYTRMEKAIPRPVEAIKLPSTSPAYTLPYAEKKMRWAQALTNDHTS